jgi:cytochrome P450
MEIQREYPVVRVKLWDGSEPWLITRYEDFRNMVTDPRLASDSDRPGYPHISAGLAARRGHVKTFISMDDPEHAAQRRLLMPDFTATKARAMRPRIQRIVDDLIDGMLAGPRHADLVSAFALPVPSLVICELLGVPYADRAFFQRVARTNNSRASTAEEATEATAELTAYLSALVDMKNADPGDDIISRLAVDICG